MIAGDMIRFAIISAIFLVSFSQGIRGFVKVGIPLKTLKFSILFCG